MNRKTWTVVLVFLTMLMLLGCAPRVVLGPVYLYPKVEPIEIELRSFSFYPNHIAIFRDQSPFTFLLKNTSEVKHNFTLGASHKNIFVSIDVKPNKSTVVSIEPPDAGNYIFYFGLGNRFSLLHAKDARFEHFMGSPIIND